MSGATCGRTKSSSSIIMEPQPSSIRVWRSEPQVKQSNNSVLKQVTMTKKLQFLENICNISVTSGSCCHTPSFNDWISSQCWNTSCLFTQTPAISPAALRLLSRTLGQFSENWSETRSYLKNHGTSETHSPLQDSHLSKTPLLHWDSHICLKATAHQTRSPVAPGLGPKITCPRLAHYSGFPCKVKSCTNLSKHTLTHLIPHLSLKCVSHSY